MVNIPKRSISAAGGNRTRFSGHQGRSVVSIQAKLLGSVWTDRKQNEIRPLNYTVIRLIIIIIIIFIILMILTIT